MSLVDQPLGRLPDQQTPAPAHQVAADELERRSGLGLQSGPLLCPLAPRREVVESPGAGEQHTRGGPSEPLVDCPERGLEMVRGAATADAPERLVELCFACSETFEQCVRCGAPFTPTDTELACGSCFAELNEKDY